MDILQSAAGLKVLLSVGHSSQGSKSSVQMYVADAAEILVQRGVISQTV